jgi:hypothetical protein
MREPSAVDLNTIDFSDSAKEIFEKAFASTDPSEALKLLTGCLKGKMILRCEALAYSTSTGFPTDFGWKPHAEWSGRLWLHSLTNSPSLEKTDPLWQPLLDFLPLNKPLIVEVGSEKFIVERIPDDSQIGGTVPSHIKFTEATLMTNVQVSS